MSAPIEDYALIGDCETAALVSRSGSIDWLCFPRFDSPACFAALLGGPEHGRWLLAPAGEPRAVRRRYREGTLVLETEFETAEGVVAVIDCMPVRGDVPDVFRVVEGRRGRVPMRTELTIRFDYGSLIPWVRRTEDGLTAIGGVNLVRVRTPVPLRGENRHTVGEFTVSPGEQIPFTLEWQRSYQPSAAPEDPERSIEATERWWREWSDRCTYRGPYRDAVVRSLITLKALTYRPSGGLLAAATTSLPERLGGVRTWDYRFCWLRDATFTLYALMLGGYTQEASDWREWLLRAVAGEPAQAQILYGVAGERLVPEWEIGWLPGYAGSTPVRVGNAAASQFQLDVYGEVIEAGFRGREAAGAYSPRGWRGQLALVEFAADNWNEPDEGIWEVRGPRRHFTHSKVMAWVAMDRGVRTVERFAAEGDAERWAKVRDEIHADVLANGFDSERNTFTQHYGSEELDASTLLIPAMGFLPGDDPRVLGMIEAIIEELAPDGFVRRYSTAAGEGQVDGLSGEEGAFLPCTCWLADALALAGRRDEARETFARVLAVGNDLGLFAEEYDPKAGRLLGNFPQAFTHLAVINTAYNLSHPARAG
jgi:GH15 family glucan-1,4-alpha-glucosidase